jgi:Raf kinase inhibitor-like YbhB/YbcL family protein
MPAQAPIPYDVLPPVPSFTVESDEIADGQPVPHDQTAGPEMGRQGKNISPGLRWSGFPSETRSFVVTIYDPDAPTGSGFWHWVLFDIPADVNELPPGAGSGEGLPPSAVHARNDAGGLGYIGPAPPDGHGPHRYVTAVHALGLENLGLDSSASPAYVGFVAVANTLARAVIVPTYAYEG